MDLSINFLSVLVAAIAAYVLGFMWHGPLFGQYWIKLMGIPQEEVAAMQAKGMGAMWMPMLGAFLQQIVVSWVVSVLLENTGLSTITGALGLAFLLWLGFIATTLLNGVMWEKRKPELYAFNVIYHLVSLLLISSILVWMA